MFHLFSSFYYLLYSILIPYFSPCEIVLYYFAFDRSGMNEMKMESTYIFIRSKCEKVDNDRRGQGGGCPKKFFFEEIVEILVRQTK